MVTDTLIFLAELSWALGLIGIDEFEERIEIALWLSDDSEETLDPRLFERGKEFENHIKEDFEAPVTKKDEKIDSSSEDYDNEDNILAFVAWSTWYFTGADPDNYPSVPHGHYQSASNSWPKLNPYTGRVFARKHQEDSSKRLTKKDMRTLWRNVAFRNFCRAHVMWYMQKYNYHRFPVRNPLRFPRW